MLEAAVAEIPAEVRRAARAVLLLERQDESRLTPREVIRMGRALDVQTEWLPALLGLTGWLTFFHGDRRHWIDLLSWEPESLPRKLTYHNRPEQLGVGIARTIMKGVRNAKRTDQTPLEVVGGTEGQARGRA